MGDKLFSTKVYEVNIYAKTFMQKSSMLAKKNGHSLCIASRQIYSIGGYDGNASLKDTQKYSIAHNKWVSLPNLQDARNCCASFALNESAVYTFGGFDENAKLNSIEKMIVAKSLKWTYVIITNSLTGRSSAHAIQISGYDVLIFGGYDGKKDSNESYVISFKGEGASCRRGSNMTLGSAFYYSSAPVFDGRL